METKTKSKLKSWHIEAYSDFDILTKDGLIKIEHLVRVKDKNNDLLFIGNDADYKIKDVKLSIRSVESITKTEFRELERIVFPDKTELDTFEEKYVVKSSVLITHIVIEKDKQSLKIYSSGCVETWGFLHSFFDFAELTQWFYDKGIAFGLHQDAWINKNFK